MTMIAQISDVHIRPRNHLYQDVADSNRMLAQAIDRLNRLDPPPDVVLITGDLTDEGRSDEYAMLRTLLATLRHPFLLMPGNHDERGQLKAAFPEHDYFPDDGPLQYAMDIGIIRLIALDSTVPGLHHGQLDSGTLQWLDQQLSACRDRPALIALHHPPFATGIPYLDIYGLREPESFAEIVNAHPHVDRIISGHVHRSMHTKLGTVPVLTCPSTVTQIALRTHADAEPASYFEPPAFFLHCWTPGKPGISHLNFIGDFDGPYPFA